MEGTFTINGKERRLSFDTRATLLDLLRCGGYIEVKKGCGEGECGSCVVLMDGKLVNSCQVFAASAMGREILTAKGIGSLQNPHPIQAAFVQTGAVQCGFCTPGMILAAHALLARDPDPEEEAIRKALDGNLCRCTGYVKIIEAVKLAAKGIRAHG
jgi:carbon-monoxide dehydrogenase small subunit